MGSITEEIWPECLITFLRVIKDSNLDKSILDLGAGGKKPPLALFEKIGFKTFGIDISKKSIELSNRYECENDVKLNIRHGDMRKLPYGDSSISFIYSQNSICHLSKEDHKLVIGEIIRVLKPNGYILLDFMSADSSYVKESELGEMVGNNEYRMKTRDEEYFHSFFVDDEPDDYFKGLEIVRKDKIMKDVRNERPYIDFRFYYYVKKC